MRIIRQGTGPGEITSPRCQLNSTRPTRAKTVDYKGEITFEILVMRLRRKGPRSNLGSFYWTQPVGRVQSFVHLALLSASYLTLLACLFNANFPVLIAIYF
jgi:hypothetical protein